MRLLLVEDSERLRRSVGTGLRKAGYVVDDTGDGTEGLWLAQSNDYDLLILDIMLPGMDGLTLLKHLRDEQRTTHVLLLTARDTVEDRVRGLKSGADDYLVKPFALEELLARVEALCRRSHGQKQSNVAVGDLEVDTSGKTVKCAGSTLRLTPREFLLIEYLVLRAGDVITRTELESRVYDEQVEPMSNVIDSAICLLRKKLTDAGSQSTIETRRGQGYVLNSSTA